MGKALDLYKKIIAGEPVGDINFALRINPVTGTVLTASVTELLKSNPDRWSWQVVNLSANTSYAGFDRETSSTRGILLVANGGNAGMNLKDDGLIVIEPLYAINAIADGAHYIVETIIL